MEALLASGHPSTPQKQPVRLPVGDQQEESHAVTVIGLAPTRFLTLPRSVRNFGSFFRKELLFSERRLCFQMGVFLGEKSGSFFEKETLFALGRLFFRKGGCPAKLGASRRKKEPPGGKKSLPAESGAFFEYRSCVRWLSPHLVEIRSRSSDRGHQDSTASLPRVRRIDLRPSYEFLVTSAIAKHEAQGFPQFIKCGLVDIEFTTKSSHLTKLF
jgi:hypothetical protein